MTICAECQQPALPARSRCGKHDFERFGKTRQPPIKITELTRSRTGANYVTIDIPIQGSTVMACPHCEKETVHATLRLNLIVCTLCYIARQDAERQPGIRP